MFGSLGLPELLLIFIVALIVFGPRKLPEIGKTLGKALNEFKKAGDELKNTIEREVHVEEIKSTFTMTPPAAEVVARSEPAPALPPPSQPLAEPVAEPVAAETTHTPTAAPAEVHSAE